MKNKDEQNAMPRSVFAENMERKDETGNKRVVQGNMEGNKPVPKDNTMGALLPNAVYLESYEEIVKPVNSEPREDVNKAVANQKKRGFAEVIKDINDKKAELDKLKAELLEVI